MAWSVDARVPVCLGGVPGAGDAVLAEGADFVLEPHGAGCACCGVQNAVGAALNRLFQQRARGEVPFFRRVVAQTTTAEGDLAVWSALRDDPVASARFRLEG